jgi:hypothetical protein
LITFAFDEEAEGFEDVGLVVRDEDGGRARIAWFHGERRVVSSWRATGYFSLAQQFRYDGAEGKWSEMGLGGQGKEKSGPARQSWPQE